MIQRILIGATIVLAATASTAWAQGGVGPGGERMRKFDTDGDGQLSEAERSAAREARKQHVIEKFDADGDGKLNQQERAAAKAEWGKRRGKAKQAGRNRRAGGGGPMHAMLSNPEKAFQAHDTDGNGSISMAEFEAMVEHVKQHLAARGGPRARGQKDQGRPGRQGRGRGVDRPETGAPGELY